MYRTQKRVMDTFLRVRAFLDAYLLTSAVGSVSAREMLDDVVRQLRG